MQEQKSLDECYGELGRAHFEAGRATLRFYPFGFDLNAGEEPVYEVVFRQPAFNQGDLDRFVGQDVEFSNRSVPAQIHHDCGRGTLDLVAASSTAVWQPYDLVDYADRVRNLEFLNVELNRDLVAARKLIGKYRSTAFELLRRAEIKAASSDELNRLQKPAIEVLKHLMSSLE